jgi:hypothetical protein
MTAGGDFAFLVLARGIAPRVRSLLGKGNLPLCWQMVLTISHLEADITNALKKASGFHRRHGLTDRYLFNSG